MEKPERFAFLSVDSQAVVQREIKAAIQGLQFVHQMAERGELNIQGCKDALSVAEHSLANVSKATGIETETAADMEERYAKVRAANMRVRELEQMLGEAVTPEQIRAGMKSLNDKLDAWWKLEGFGHISNCDFGSFGCKVELSCSLFTGSGWHSEEPVSKAAAHAAWLESLPARGFKLMTDGSRDKSVVDCDASRKALVDLIMFRFPTARITEIKNHCERNGAFSLRSITAYIYDLGQIGALPTTPGELKHP